MRRSLLLRSLAALGIILITCATLVWWHMGFHTIEPNEVYGSPQLSPSDLKKKIKAHNIRAIINLRGTMPTSPWYQDEVRIASEMNVSHCSVPLSSKYLPFRKEFCQVLEALESSPKPVLIHCQSGIDRTGFLTILYLLLNKDEVTPENVLNQLPLWRGHLSWRKSYHTKKLFLRYYRRWLDRQQLSHTPEHFRQWASDHYCDRIAREVNKQVNEL